MDDNRLIGSENQLPWKLPADMRWFVEQTMGKPVIMGRKTFDSIGKPLPGRLNLVISRQPDLHIGGCSVVHSLQEALESVGNAEEVMVMGGAEIYKLALPEADRLYITRVHGSFVGDAWFPEFELKAWKTMHFEEHTEDEKNPYSHSFTILERRS